MQRSTPSPGLSAVLGTSPSPRFSLTLGTASPSPRFSPSFFTPKTLATNLTMLKNTIIDGEYPSVGDILDKLEKSSKLPFSSSAQEEKKAKNKIKNLLNTIDLRGNLLLHEAIKVFAKSINQGSIAVLTLAAEAIKNLLDHGANPNELNGACEDALHCAVVYLSDVKLDEKTHLSEIKETPDADKEISSEELFEKMLQNLFAAGAIVKEKHIELLQAKGHLHFAEILREKKKEMDERPPRIPHIGFKPIRT